MHALVCSEPALERELLLQSRIEAGVRTLLFYVDGDAATYEAGLEALANGDGPAGDDDREATADETGAAAEAEDGETGATESVSEATEKETGATEGAADDTAAGRSLSYDVHPTDDGAYVFVRAPTGERDEGLVSAFRRAGLVVVPPTAFRSDRTMVLTVVGEQASMQGVLADLPDALDVTVLRTGSFEAVRGPSLTERQREALATAQRLGYYDVPREAGVEAVADALDCAVSTASTILRRGEAALVDDAVGPADDAD